MTNILIGYARVSTHEQNPDLQHDALRQAGVVDAHLFTDRASGARADRPQLAEALRIAREGDTLVVWRLDRLGRSLQHLVEIVNELRERGVGLRSLNESIDTTTTGGRLILHIFAALAEFERDTIRDRTLAGLAAAKARGRVGGGRTVMTGDRLAAAAQLLALEGASVRAVAKTIGVSPATLYRHLDSL